MHRPRRRQRRYERLSSASVNRCGTISVPPAEQDLFATLISAQLTFLIKNQVHLVCRSANVRDQVRPCKTKRADRFTVQSSTSFPYSSARNVAILFYFVFTTASASALCCAALHFPLPDLEKKVNERTADTLRCDHLP